MEMRLDMQVEDGLRIRFWTKGFVESIPGIQQRGSRKIQQDSTRRSSALLIRVLFSPWEG